MTILAGLVALLSYIEGVTEGPLSPEGKPDIAFEVVDELYNVIVGARGCIQAHLERTAA